MNLQMVTYGEIRPKNISKLLHEKGVTDPEELKKVINASIERFAEVNGESPDIAKKVEGDATGD